MKNSFEEIMKEKSDIELKKIILSKTGDYRPEAMEAALNESKKRGFSRDNILKEFKDLEKKRLLNEESIGTSVFNSEIGSEKSTGFIYLNKKNKTRLSLKLTKEQEQFIKGFSFGGLFAGVGGIIMVLIYNIFTKRIKRMEIWEWISIVPIVNLFIALWLGVESRRLSWEKGDWESFEEFFEEHKKIDVWLPVLAIILVIVGVSR